MRILQIIAFALVASAVIGCKPNIEAQVPGTWSDGKGMSQTFKDDKTWSATISGAPINGTWVVDNGDVVATPTTFAGQPIDKVKAAAASMQNSQTPAAAQQFIQDLDKPNYYTMSADGKSMSTDKTRDRNSGPGETLTKQ